MSLSFLGLWVIDDSRALFAFRFNKDLSALKCEERQKSKLIEIIRSALNEVSCEELPNGCDDLSVEIENNNLGNHEQMVRANSFPKA